MPVYEYSALDAATGKTVQGIVDADSPAAARQKIRSQGNYPVSVAEAADKRRLSFKGFSLQIFVIHLPVLLLQMQQQQIQDLLLLPWLLQLLH